MRKREKGFAHPVPNQPLLLKKKKRELGYFGEVSANGEVWVPGSRLCHPEVGTASFPWPTGPECSPKTSPAKTPHTGLGVSLVSSRTEIKQVIFSSLAATRPACSIRIIQLPQIPINNAIRIVTSRLPPTYPFLRRSPCPSSSRGEPPAPRISGVIVTPRRANTSLGSVY